MKSLIIHSNLVYILEQLVKRAVSWVKELELDNM